MSGSTGFALAGRAGLSLVVVLGLMWVVGRALRARSQGGRVAGIEVLARHSLGRSASLTVVRVADRALVLGVTESSVTLLRDCDLPAQELTVTAPATAVPGMPVERDLELASALLAASGHARPDAARATGPLAGSVLAPATWRATVDALRERTVRRA